MPTFVDPAKWIPELLDQYWAQAIDSLRSEGKQVSSNKPTFRATGTRAATGSIQNAVSAKVYAATDETTNRVTHGDLDEDSTASWAVKYSAGGEYEKARGLTREAVAVTHRLLLMYRMNPHPEWHRIEAIREIPDADYPDYQSRTIQFTLLRYGEATPTKLTQITT